MFNVVVTLFNAISLLPLLLLAEVFFSFFFSLRFDVLLLLQSHMCMVCNQGKKDRYNNCHLLKCRFVAVDAVLQICSFVRSFVYFYFLLFICLLVFICLFLFHHHHHRFCMRFNVIWYRFVRVAIVNSYSYSILHRLSCDINLVAVVVVAVFFYSFFLFYRWLCVQANA